jgi:hypothetical protein
LIFQRRRREKNEGLWQKREEDEEKVDLVAEEKEKNETMSDSQCKMESGKLKGKLPKKKNVDESRGGRKRIGGK